MSPKRIQRKNPWQPNPAPDILQSRPFSNGKGPRESKLPSTSDILQTRPFSPRDKDVSKPEDTRSFEEKMQGAEFRYNGVSIPAVQREEVAEENSQEQAEGGTSAANISVFAPSMSPPPENSIVSPFSLRQTGGWGQEETIQREEEVEEQREVGIQKQQLQAPPDDGIVQRLCDECEGELAEKEEKTPVQAKLTVGEAGDKYEQEADAVARDVVEKINAPTTEPSVQLQKKDSIQGNISKLDREAPIQRQKEKSENKRPGEVLPPTYGGVVPIPIPIEEGQWYSVDREVNPTDPNRSFWKAAVYNTKHNNYWAYGSIAQRHAFYKFADAYLNSVDKAIKSQWFAAAAVVTGDDAVGAAEGINLWYLSDDTEKFLKAGNEFLFPYNMKNFSYLMEGKDIPGMEKFRGKALDNALVDFEQTKVQEFIDKYKGDGSLEDITKQINNAFDAFLAPDLVKKVIKDSFVDQGIEFDFKKYQHRVILGKQMVDKLYKKKGLKH